MKAAVAGPSVTLTAVIVRACRECGGKREIGRPCPACGNTRPPDVRDLGVIASRQRSLRKRLAWNLWGCHLAQQRIRHENKRMLRENLKKGVLVSLTT